MFLTLKKWQTEADVRQEVSATLSMHGVIRKKRIHYFGEEDVRLSLILALLHVNREQTTMLTAKTNIHGAPHDS